MTKIKVRLVQLGTPPVSLKELLGWKSDFFEIEAIQHLPDLPDSDLAGWAYSNEALKKLIESGDSADIKMGVVYAPLENNYYMHRLSNHACVLSLFEMAEILTEANIPLEAFVIRNVYMMVVLYLELGSTIKSDVYKVPHEDTRGCLFDFNAFKPNAIWSTESVNLCTSCKSRLMKRQLPLDFIKNLERELRRVKKPFAFRVLEFIKKHPAWSTIISALFALALNIFASIAYVLWLKKYFEHPPLP